MASNLSKQLAKLQRDVDALREQQAELEITITMQWIKTKGVPRSKRG